MTPTKSEWRRRLLAARAAIPADDRRLHGAAIVERVRALPWFADAATLLAYEPMGAEVDPATLLEDRRPSLLPLVRPEDDETRWTERDAASAAGTAARELAYPVLAIVPGVGYDLRGTRLGRGRGYYDRALTELRRCGGVWVVALAFECQVVPELPVDPWDAPMDAVVTERRVIHIRGREPSRVEARP